MWCLYFLQRKIIILVYNVVVVVVLVSKIMQHKNVKRLKISIIIINSQLNIIIRCICFHLVQS